MCGRGGQISGSGYREKKRNGYGLKDGRFVSDELDGLVIPGDNKRCSSR